MTPLAKDCEVLIIGAGCAGLSLAANLAKAGWSRGRVLVLDGKAGFSNDRTWCSFAVQPHLFQDLVTHRWSRWRVVDDRRDVVRGSSEVAYEHLPAAAFYARALEMIEEHEGIDVVLDRPVHEVVDRGDHVEVTTRGGVIRAGIVFDSRPFEPEPARAGDVTLLQHFAGWFVALDSPSFDPACATLMDFRVGSRESIHFLYVLPFSETEALIESTVFSAVRWDAAEHEAVVERYLADKGLSPYRVTRKEDGVLPMTSRRFCARPSPRVYRMGLGGGLARPASGYAFLAIQRYAAAMASALGRTELPEPPRVRSTRATALDHVFLAYLRDHPAEASGLFTSLFAGVDPVGLARFLGDAGTVRDDLRVIHALPARKLGLQAVRTAGQRARRLSLLRRSSYATR